MMDSPAISRLDRLIGPQAQLRRFADLPRPYQLALVHYMAVDGEAWPTLFASGRRWSRRRAAAILTAALPQYVDLVGTSVFGVARLSVSAVRRAVLEDPEIAGHYADWSAYRDAMWAGKGEIPHHATAGRWPVILSSTDDETLQDGWHRLHCYLAQGARAIPAVYYPQPQHLAQHARRMLEARPRHLGPRP